MFLAGMIFLMTLKATGLIDLRKALNSQNLADTRHPKGRAPREHGGGRRSPECRPLWGDAGLGRFLSPVFLGNFSRIFKYTVMLTAQLSSRIGFEEGSLSGLPKWIF